MKYLIWLRNIMKGESLKNCLRTLLDSRKVGSETPFLGASWLTAISNLHLPNSNQDYIGENQLR